MKQKINSKRELCSWLLNGRQEMQSQISNYFTSVKDLPDKRLTNFLAKLYIISTEDNN